MILVRRLLGDVLRQERQRQGRTLRDVSAQAQVSLGYLSEIERGRKEASSECLAAICASLRVPLSAVLADVSDEVARVEVLDLGGHQVREPVLALHGSARPRAGTVTDLAA
jgi:transcriptional regulator with XRE-family HTH domain